MFGDSDVRTRATNALDGAKSNSRPGRITSIDGSGFVTVEYADGSSAGTTRTVESGIFVSRINMDVGGPPVVGDTCTVSSQIFSPATVTGIISGQLSGAPNTRSTGSFSDRFSVRYKDGRSEKFIRPGRLQVINKHIALKRRESQQHYGTHTLVNSSHSELLPLPQVKIGDEVAIEQPTLNSNKNSDELEELLKRFDKTGSGEVQYSAFCNFLREGLCMDLSRYRVSADGDVDALEELENDTVLSFCETLDANGDGRTSIKELMDAVNMAAYRLGIGG